MIDTLKIQNLVFLLFVVLSIISSNDSTNYALVFLPSYFGIFVKFIDFFMTVKNAYYYFDMYFLFNMSLLFTVHDLEINTKQTETVIFLFVSCLVLQLSLVEFYFIEILHKLLNSFLICVITIPMFLFSCISSIFICNGWSTYVLFVLLFALLKLLFLAHMYYYRKDRSIYTKFLIELGGGESPLQKNIGYHIVNNHFKITLVTLLICPMITKSAIVFAISIMIGFSFNCVFIYVCYTDYKVISNDNVNNTEEEIEQLKKQVGIDDALVAVSI